MENFLPIATGIVAFLSSILSGLAGGGGGFIMAPYWLLTGMTPAQGATTGAFMALGMGSSSLAAYRGSGSMPTDKKFIGIILAMTLLASNIGPFFLQQIHIQTFKPILAALTIGSLPFLFINRGGLYSPRGKEIGFVMMTLLLLASSFITSSAFSILMTVVLMRSFTLTTLQSTALRRLIGIIQSAVIFAILAILGNFVWEHAVAALIGGSLGSYIGTRLNLRRGEVFAKYALATGASISALALLF